MKNSSILGTISALSFAVALGALGGCASTGDLSSVKATADGAAQTANAAQSAAASATTTANAAEKKADAAAAKADHAQSTADKALAEIQELNEKLDRMFKKNMQK